jgi:hypothetical protein
MSVEANEISEIEKYPTAGVFHSLVHGTVRVLYLWLNRTDDINAFAVEMYIFETDNICFSNVCSPVKQTVHEPVLWERPDVDFHAIGWHFLTSVRLFVGSFSSVCRS